jgi:hypothetical protein
MSIQFPSIARSLALVAPRHPQTPPSQITISDTAISDTAIVDPVVTALAELQQMRGLHRSTFQVLARLENGNFLSLRQGADGYYLVARKIIKFNDELGPRAWQERCGKIRGFILLLSTMFKRGLKQYAFGGGWISRCTF